MQFYSLFLAILFLSVTRVSSLSIEDRLQQVETQLLRTGIELDLVRKDNGFLKTEVSDLKHEDGKNKQKIQKLDQENGRIRSDLEEAHSKLADLDRKLQEVQLNCCQNSQGGQTTVTSWPVQSTTDEITNTENEVIDIGLNTKMFVIKELGYVAIGGEPKVEVYDLHSKQLVCTPNNEYVWDIKQFKQTQLVQANRQSISIWDLENCTQVKTLPCPSCRAVFAIALNKNESLMLSGDSSNTMILWDMLEYKQIRAFSGHSSSVTSVLFNEDKDQVISGSGYPDSTIKVWNMNDGSLIRTLTGHNNRVNNLLLDPSGRLYSAAGGRIIEWDLERGTALRTFTDHPSFVQDLMWSEDGKRLVSASQDKSVIIRSIETGQIIKQVNYTFGFFGLALNPFNGQLMTTSGDNKLIFWPFKP